MVEERVKQVVFMGVVFALLAVSVVVFMVPAGPAKSVAAPASVTAPVAEDVLAFVWFKNRCRMSGHFIVIGPDGDSVYDPRQLGLSGQRFGTEEMPSFPLQFKLGSTYTVVFADRFEERTLGAFTVSYQENRMTIMCPWRDPMAP